jgi:hypothetical protein
MDASAVQSSSVEVSLRSAGAKGLTIVELMAATDMAETTIRRRIREHVEAGEVHKVPTLDGAKIVWGSKPGGSASESIAPRRKEAADRDERVAEILRVNQRISMNEIARILEMPDINEDGWSQLIYVSLQRLRKKGVCERRIEWVYTGKEKKTKED